MKSFLLLPFLPLTLGDSPSAPWNWPCDNATYSSFPFCDTSLDVETRTADYVGRISLDDKLGRNFNNTPLSNTASPMPSVGTGAYQWWSEALHGVASSPGVTFDVITSATSFPQVIATSMSFNRTLFAAVGDAISTEARAFANYNQSGYTFWTPNLNIFRDPRWGRGQETPGEDPYLTSAYVSVYVPGLQGGVVGTDGVLKVSACCKHYLGYSLEDWEGIDRFHFDAIISEQDLADTYLPAFEACVSPDKGAGSAMMCSYNSVNGVPSCASHQYLTEIARNTWDFQGYITSDCGAVECVYSTHHYASDPIGAVVDVLEAGTDTDCGSWFDNYLEKAYDQGRVNETLIDAALTRLVTTQMRLGLFNSRQDASNPYNQLGPDDVGTDAHNQLALKAARQAVTMLKNQDNQALPWDTSTLSSIALIGPNANATVTMQGNYEGVAPYLISPLMGLSEYSPVVNYAQGCDINTDDESGFDEAVDAVRASDAVVMVMGLDQSCESEGHDRTTIALPQSQQDLIETVLTAASSKPVVLVIMSGGAVCLGMYKDDDRISAIYFVGYPGQSGGKAIAEVIYGDYNPSGRLTQTFYQAPFVDEVSMLDMGMRHNATTENPGRTYRFYTGENVVYPFGTGLSYATFTYSLNAVQSTITSTNNDDDIVATVAVTATNTGSVDGVATLLVYLSPPSEVTGFTSDDLPLKSLRGFGKHFLRSDDNGGDNVVVANFDFREEDFSIPNGSGEMVFITGDWTVSIQDCDTTLTITV